MRLVLQQAQRQNPEATYSTIADQFDPVLDQLITERTLLALEMTMASTFRSG